MNADKIRIPAKMISTPVTAPPSHTGRKSGLLRVNTSAINMAAATTNSTGHSQKGSPMLIGALGVAWFSLIASSIWNRPAVDQKSYR